MSTIEKKSPKIDAKIKELLQAEVLEEAQVIIHITFIAKDDMMIRIWPTTYLYPLHSNYISDLLFTDNITLAPIWTPIPVNYKHTFTLIFQGLPKGCKHFDLIELITESGGFEFRNINRNKSDVYHLTVG